MIDMNDIYLISTLAVSSILSIWLFYYDVKHFKLPNIGVLALALLAFLFNYLNNFTLVSLNNMFVGAIVGFVFLLTIRAIANYYYKRETLGLGDVKLIFAIGLWVGYPNILITLSLGAFLGAIIGYSLVIIGRIRKSESMLQSSSRIPAGPGFIVAMFIVLAQIYSSLLYILLFT